MMAPSDDEWWYRREREMAEEDAARARAPFQSNRNALWVESARLVRNAYASMNRPIGSYYMTEPSIRVVRECLRAMYEEQDALRAASSSSSIDDHGFHESMERFEDDSVPERVDEEPA